MRRGIRAGMEMRERDGGDGTFKAGDNMTQF